MSMGMKRRIKERALLGSSILDVELVELGRVGFVNVENLMVGWGGECKLLEQSVVFVLNYGLN